MSNVIWLYFDHDGYYDRITCPLCGVDEIIHCDVEGRWQCAACNGYYHLVPARMVTIPEPIMKVSKRTGQPIGWQLSFAALAPELPDNAETKTES